MTEIIAWLILDLLAFYGLYRLLKLAAKHVYGEGIAGNRENLCVFTALFESKPETGIPKLFKSHYRLPPLPPTTISLTRILGWPTLVGTLPD